MRVDLIIRNAAQILTCASNGNPKRGDSMRDLGIIAKGAIAIQGRRIAAVGSAEQILRDYESLKTVDAAGKVVCPGFVDPHTHIVFGGDRIDEFELKVKGKDYLEILQAGGGILSTVKSTRDSSLEDLVKVSHKRLQKILESGTTTAELKTGYGLDLESELKMLEAIGALQEESRLDLVPTFLPAHTFPQEFRGSEEKYVKLIIEEMLPGARKWFKSSCFTQKRKDFPVPFFADVFCEKGAFDLAQTREVLKAAKLLGFGLKPHVDEFSNLGGAEMAIELGATSIDHLDKISEREIELLAKSSTIGIVTPTVNFHFGSTQFADARKFIDKGCAIAVSTDYNPGSAPCPSQPMAMQIASRYQKLLPAETYNAATINAAFGIGLGQYLGSLEAGKQADLLILNTKDYREPVYEFGSNFVELVIKKGEIILDKR